MREVAVIGTGMNAWGEIWGRSLRDLFAEAALAALDDAGIKKVDSLVVGNMSGGLFVGQEHLGSLLTDYSGMAGIPGTRVESACASGGLAFNVAAMQVASGAYDIVLAGGVEKMTDVSGDGATYALATAADQEYEVFQGATFPGLYAMIATAHMAKYGTTREMMASVAVKNHDNGLKNPNAQYHLKIAIADVLNAVKVADPLTILDCSPITDGAAAVIVTTVENAKKMGRPYIRLTGFGHSTSTIQLAQRQDMTWLDATANAAAKAYKMSGKGPGDIHLAEVHDCFTIAEICVTEALGFFEKGKGGPAALEGKTRIGGQIPVNASGGLKSKGHPVGATGIAQIVELYKQLTGHAGDRQVASAKVGLAQNMGGSGGSTLVHILEVA